MRGLRGGTAAVTLKPSEEKWRLVEMLELGTVWLWFAVLPD